MPASEFRRQKLYFVFDKFFDVNKSGTIEKKDFELAVQHICQIRGWKEGEKNYDLTRTRFMEIWDLLRVRADANMDDQVSRDEWCELWMDQDKSEEWQKSYMNFMFQLQDTSGDGCIDESEFTNVCTSFGVDMNESREAFGKLSKNGKTIVDLDYYAGLWKDYFYSDDAGATGNCIFGKTSFP